MYLVKIRLTALKELAMSNFLLICPSSYEVIRYSGVRNSHQSYALSQLFFSHWCSQLPKVSQKLSTQRKVNSKITCS